MEKIRTLWRTSKKYRVFLIAAIIYALLRLTVQIYLFSDALQPEAIAQGAQVSADLQESYIPAAQHFRAHKDLYIKGSLDVVEAHFLYSPAFAFFFGPLLLIPINILVPILVVLHIIAYWLLFVWWYRIFYRNNLDDIARIWLWLLPLFLVFSVFWDDLAYMNTYLIVALFATFAIDAVMQEKLAQGSIWLAVILAIKPQWAFAIAIPLLLGRYRFFLKLLTGTVITYLVIAGITIIAGGVNYGLQQYKDYFGFLTRLSYDYPWRGPDQPFLGYDHSIIQIVLYYFGVSTANIRVATIIKLFLLAPIGWISFKFLRLPKGQPLYEISSTTLAFAFSLYLGAFIWLNNVWELSLGLVIFAYLLATTKEKWAIPILWILYGPYALLDIWRLITYIIFGDSILYQGAYVLTDPILYVPWIMITLLVSYALLLRKLNILVNKPA